MSNLALHYHDIDSKQNDECTPKQANNKYAIINIQL